MKATNAEKEQKNYWYRKYKAKIRDAKIKRHLSERQGHLLSCPGQLKSDIWFQFQVPKVPDMRVRKRPLLLSKIAFFLTLALTLTLTVMIVFAYASHMCQTFIGQLMITQLSFLCSCHWLFVLIMFRHPDSRDRQCSNTINLYRIFECIQSSYLSIHQSIYAFL